MLFTNDVVAVVCRCGVDKVKDLLNGLFDGVTLLAIGHREPDEAILLGQQTLSEEHREVRLWLDLVVAVECAAVVEAKVVLVLASIFDITHPLVDRCVVVCGHRGKVCRCLLEELVVGIWYVKFRRLEQLHGVDERRGERHLRVEVDDLASLVVVLEKKVDPLHVPALLLDLLGQVLVVLVRRERDPLVVVIVDDVLLALVLLLSAPPLELLLRLLRLLLRFVDLDLPHALLGLFDWFVILDVDVGLLDSCW